MSKSGNVIKRWIGRSLLLGGGLVLAYWLVFTLRFLRDYVPHGGAW